MLVRRLPWLLGHEDDDDDEGSPAPRGDPFSYVPEDLMDLPLN